MLASPRRLANWLPTVSGPSIVFGGKVPSQLVSGQINTNRRTSEQTFGPGKVGKTDNYSARAGPGDNIDDNNIQLSGQLTRPIGLMTNELLQPLGRRRRRDDKITFEQFAIVVVVGGGSWSGGLGRPSARIVNNNGHKDRSVG